MRRYEIPVRVSGMILNGIDNVCDRASEGQAAGLYESDFTAGPLVGIGLKDQRSRLVLVRS
jgi:hypothetical protein